MAKKGPMQQEIDREARRQYKNATLAALQKIGLELSYLRQLRDTKHIFENDDEEQRRLVVEGAEKPTRVQPAEKPIMEDTPPTPQDIMDLDPEQLEWEEFTSGRGKTTWRHPFKGQTLQLSPTWKALKAAILSQPKTHSGRQYYHQGEFFYFLSDDGGIAFKQQRNFKPRKPRGGA